MSLIPSKYTSFKKSISTKIESINHPCRFGTRKLNQSLFDYYLEKYNSTDFSTVKFLRLIAQDHPRSYLNEFQLNMILSESRKLEKVIYYRNSWPNDFIDIEEVVFLMMSSKKNRLKALKSVITWLSLTRHFYIFADENDSSIPHFITLPELRGKSSYDDAQHRQLRGMKWLRTHKPRLSNKNWFVLVDDDTWINIPALLHFLHHYSPELPVNFGFVWDDVWELGKSVQSGGAAMVLSRMAFHNLADNLYTDKIPFDKLNDVTLANGCKALGIVLVHSDKFHWNTVETVPKNDRLMVYPPNYLQKISYHYINSLEMSMQMTCDVAKFWNFLGPQSCEK